MKPSQKNYFVTCDRLSDSQVILRHFDDRDAGKISKVPGARFVKGDRTGGPHFKAPADLQTLRRIRSKLGDRVRFSSELVAWAKVKQEETKRILNIALQEDADLPIFREHRPEIYEQMRPDQRVGTKWLAESPGGLLADDPGLGKTWQAIASIIESKTLTGPQLVVCPKISIDNVWLVELNALQDEPVFIAPEGRPSRIAMLKEMAACHEEDIPFWLVVNWSMITLKNDRFQFSELDEIMWENVIVDEAHDTGMANQSSATARGFMRLGARKRIALTGTPMGGKPLRLWGILHWLDQHEFSDQYQWAERWVRGYDQKIPIGDGKERSVRVWDSVPKSLEEKFKREHSRYILRRTSEEVNAKLAEGQRQPPPHHQDIWFDLEPKKQQPQYEEMDEQARIAIEQDEQVVGYVNQANMLATYAWLKQFANGYCDLEIVGEKINPLTGEPEPRYKAYPTQEASPKLEGLWEVVKELAIHEGSSQRLIVGSQFRGWVRCMEEFLQAKKIPVASIHGGVTQKKRNALIRDFQDPKGTARVMCLSTKAAGTSINLDAADTVIVFDETWNPDEQDQLIRRCIRARRIHLVTVKWFRTRGTIEEDVRRTNKRKRNLNEMLLNRHKEIEW